MEDPAGLHWCLQTQGAAGVAGEGCQLGQAGVTLCAGRSGSGIPVQELVLPKPGCLVAKQRPGCCSRQGLLPSWPGAKEPGWGAPGCPPGHFGLSPVAKLLSWCPVLACGLRDGPGVCLLPQRGQRLCPSLAPLSKAAGCGFLRRWAWEGNGLLWACGTSASKRQGDALHSCHPVSKSIPLTLFSLFLLSNCCRAWSLRILCLLKDMGLPA